MKHFNLEDEFQEFIQKVFPTLPEDARQYQDVRRIFFAGIGCLYIYMTFELTEGNASDAEAVRELENIKDQLDEFFHNK